MVQSSLIRIKINISAASMMSKVRLGNTGTKQIEARRSDIKNNIEK